MHFIYNNLHILLHFFFSNSRVLLLKIINYHEHLQINGH